MISEKVTPSSIIHLITQRSGLRKIIANTGWLFVDQVAATLGGFLVGAWVARYLGPTRYGIYNYALAVVALLTPLVALGLKDIVIRDIVRAPEDKDEILGTTFGLQLIGSFLSLGLAIGIAQVMSLANALTAWLIVILAGQFIFQGFSFTLSILVQLTGSSEIHCLGQQHCLVPLLPDQARPSPDQGAPYWLCLGSSGPGIRVRSGSDRIHRISGQMLFTWQVSFALPRGCLGTVGLCSSLIWR